MKLLLLIGLLMSQLTFAGKENGNGGVSVVCRDLKGDITSAEILDIYEGKVLYNRTYSTEPISVDTQILLTQLKLVNFPAFVKDVKDELSLVQANIVFLPQGTELIPTNDALPIITKKGCKFEQLANYTDEGEVFVSQEIYDRLDNTNKAALLMHEAVYAIRRKAGDTTSQKARRLVAQLFASNGDQAVINALVMASTRTSFDGAYKQNATHPCVLNFSTGNQYGTIMTITNNENTKCEIAGKAYKVEFIGNNKYKAVSFDNQNYFFKVKKESIIIATTLADVDQPHWSTEYFKVK